MCIVQGSAQWLCRPCVRYSAMHGATGLDGAIFPPTTRRPLATNCWVHIANTILHAPRGVHFVCTGPLTNLAILLKAFPEVMANIEEIIFMGGAIGIGNTTPAAEWNMWCDPEAAHVVVHSGLRVVMVPLDATKHVPVTPDVLARLDSLPCTPPCSSSNSPGQSGNSPGQSSNSPGQSGNSPGQSGNSPGQMAGCGSSSGEQGASLTSMLGGMLRFRNESISKKYGSKHSWLHDPCTVAYVIDPSLVTLEHMHVDVEYKSAHCDGRTVCDRCVCVCNIFHVFNIHISHLLCRKWCGGGIVKGFFRKRKM